MQATTTSLYTFARKHTHILIAVCLICIPSIWWPSALIVSGDDSSLYYRYPLQVITHYASQVIVNSQPGSPGGYFPMLFLVPFMSIIYVVQLVTGLADVQKVMFGLNLAGMYLGARYFVTSMSRAFDMEIRPMVASIAGLVYLTAPMLYYGPLSQFLYTMYATSIIPLTAGLLVDALSAKSWRSTYLLGIVMGVFSFVFFLPVYAIPCIIGSLPLAALLIYRYRDRAIPRLVALVVMFALVQSYTIYHIIWSLYMSYGMGSTGVARQVIGSMKDVVKYTLQYYASVNNIFYNLSASTSPLQYAGDPRAYEHTKIFGLLMFNTACVLVVYTVLARRSTNKAIYLTLAATYAVLLALVTVNIGTLQMVNILTWVMTNIPGFALMKHTVDKFSIIYSLIYAMMFAVGMQYLYTKAQAVSHMRLGRWVLGVYIVINLILTWPLIHARTYLHPRLAGHSLIMIDEFPTDYENLVSYIKAHPANSRYLWIPMNTGAYIHIPDARNPDYWYLGVSPLTMLEGIQTYSSTMSTLPSRMREDLSDALIAKDYVALGRVLSQLDIQYVIHAKKRDKYLSESWVFPQAFLNESEIISAIAGTRIVDIGDSYSIYELKKTYANQKIQVKDAQGHKVPVQIIKHSPTHYTFEYVEPAGDYTLEYYESYSPLWDIKLDASITSHTQLHGYANTWAISQGTKRTVTGSIDFVPERYTGLAVAVSLVSLITVILLYARTFWAMPRIRATHSHP